VTIEPAEQASGQYDFEDGTTQGWVPRGEEASVSVANDVAHSGSYSLLATDRIEEWNGATVDVLGLLEPGNTYKIGAYVRLAEGEPDSRVILTMQRTPVDGDTVYEWIAPSAEGGVTDGEWVYLEGAYPYNAEAAELMLYVESPDDALVDFYVDDVILTLMQSEGEMGAYDFEDGTTQGWEPRGDAFVNVVDDVAYSGSYSLLAADRTANWQGATIDVLGMLEPGKTYEIGAYVRLAEGEPDSRVILTMQRTPVGGSTAYEWIAPSAEDGVTDAEWVYLQGQYSFSGEVSELLLYVESPDDELVDFYVDDITIAALLNPPPQTDIGSVYETLADYFLVGAALGPSHLDSENHTQLLTRHFNSLTPENTMKPGPIQPEEGDFRWANADRMVEFARENGIAVHGHTLVWHQQAAEWMFLDADGNEMEPTPENKELLLQRMETHIRAVVSRYKDDVNVWDVVNEVIDNSEPDCMRKSAWYNVTGMDYIVRAFEIAREESPDATLILNDYGTTNEVKRECIYNLVHDLQEMGVPVDGIGMQMHVNIQDPPTTAMEESITRFAELGEVHITELDVSLYTNDTDSYDAVPDEVLLRLGYRYKEIFEVLKRQAEHIGSVTFWGLADDTTWLKTFPTTRINLPLLFDEQLQAKYAYWGVVDPSKLPVWIQKAEAPKGTPTIDAELEVQWVLQTWTPLDGTGTLTASFQTRWDENTVYLFVDVEDPAQNLDTIEVFIDENNGKTGTYEDGDQHFTFQDGECVACGDVTFSITTDENGSRLEAAFPLSEEAKIGKEIGFDLRITDGSQPDAPVSWNDKTHSQDTDTSKFATLTFADAPRVTTAARGTPVIDGVEDDVWADAAEITTGVWVMSSDDGSTARVKTLWDSERLYVYAIVTDGLLSNASSNPWEQDSIEVFVDQNNAKTTSYQADDGQYRVSYENEQSFRGGASADKIESAVQITDDGYVVELGIILDAIEPQAGMLIGFDFQVNNDGNGNGLRDSVVLWNDPTHQSYQNTSRLGLLQFVE
jgi:endo-1,4-beta-xylanase